MNYQITVSIPSDVVDVLYASCTQSQEIAQVEGETNADYVARCVLAQLTAKAKAYSIWAANVATTEAINAAYAANPISITITEA